MWTTQNIQKTVFIAALVGLDSALIYYDCNVDNWRRQNFVDFRRAQTAAIDRMSDTDFIQWRRTDAFFEEKDVEQELKIHHQKRALLISGKKGGA